MFTGIIQTVGTVRRADRAAESMALTVGLGEIAREVAVGDSVAVDGICLTATSVAAPEVTFDAGAETLQRTTLNEFRANRPVNIELAMTAGGRFGGHIVQGHVDGVGTLAAVTPDRGGRTLRFAVPGEVADQLVMKGSVAVDGISLTVSGLGDDWFEVYLIPHTLANTTLPGKRIGARVNVETDIIGKYVARFLRKHSSGGLTERTLRENGFA